MSAIDDLTKYYQDLLIIQYFNKPKARGVIGAFVGTLLADAIAISVRDGFALDTAVGQQLDFLGKLRGVTRYSYLIDLNKTYVGIPSATDGAIASYMGLASYYDSALPPWWYVMSYDDFTTHTLLDGEFRRVIKYLAKVHSSDHAYASLDALCYEFFGGNVDLVDNLDMTITYRHLTSDTDSFFLIVKQMELLPKLAGVTVTTAEVASF